MSADLRQRLDDGLSAFCREGCADAALAVFAAWLRERAEAAGMQYRAEAELRRLADELDPPKGD